MTLQVRVKSLAWEAPGIVSYELRPVAGHALPPFTAGAHIDVALPAGLVRSYSILNSQNERHRYVIAVQNDRASRGGSRWIHENVRPGDVLSIHAPRNNFPLCETAGMSIFIAGGIGITPILGMVDRLSELDRPWKLIYCARSRESAAFIDRLEPEPSVRFHFDEDAGGRFFDVGSVVAAGPADAHLYCCGPSPMLSAFEKATEGIDPSRVHVEYFSGREPVATDGAFTVLLKRTGRQVHVASGTTILEALRSAGIDMPYSCLEGVCGSCETTVLEGTPDHRDLVLTEAERASNKTIILCCSRSKTDELVLDL